MGLLTRIFFSIAVATCISAQTWCGKDYTVGSPIIPPGGHFPIPVTSLTPLLALRCGPAISPYLPSDVAAPAEILIDTLVTFSSINGTAPITLPSDFSSSPPLTLSVTIDGKEVAQGAVPLNATKFALPFPLSTLQPSAQAYNMSCTATYSLPSAQKQIFTATSLLSYIPAPSSGSVTKMDLRTGALLVSGPNGEYEPIFPIGFYTSFDGYLDTNLTVLDELKEMGFNIVHPVPSFDNLTALSDVFDRMEELGLYIMYDMRNTYMNTTSVTSQVNSVKSRPNLLLWYTADEPDGTSDPLTATVSARSLINTLDSGHHPVSLVLNCQDYFWEEYTAGADIVMQDTYMIGNNVTFSSQWGTACTPDYGCCGCDNCQGNFNDITSRMDQFKDRLQVEGWDIGKAVWTVPQAFGNDTFWPRYPTGKEYVVQSVLGINHGALGVVAWNDPTTPDIKSSASLLAKSLPSMTPFIFSHTSTFLQFTSNGVDVGVWSVGDTALVLATNTNYANVDLSFDLGTMIPGGAFDVAGMQAMVNQVLDSGATVASVVGSKAVFSFEEVGSGAFVLTKNDSVSQNPQKSGAKTIPMLASQQFALETKCRPLPKPPERGGLYEIWKKYKKWLVQGLVVLPAVVVWLFLGLG